MTGLKYEKPHKYKIRRAHPKSILQEKDGTCYLCARNGDYRKKTVQEHHVFGGPNRIHSESHGLKVYLCLQHHTAGPEAVHNNIQNMRTLQQDAQRAFEENHTREEFVKLIGRNFLEEPEQQQTDEAKEKNGFFWIGEEVEI